MPEPQSRTTLTIDADDIFPFIHKMMFASVFVYAVAGELLAPRHILESPVLPLVLMIVAIATTVLTVLIKSRLVDTAAQALRRRDDSNAISRWRTGQLGVLAMSEAVALFGLILRMVGGRLTYAAALYLLGLILLLIMRPTRPSI